MNKIRQRFMDLGRGLKLVILIPPAAIAVAAILAFASDQMPATRGRLKQVEIRVDTIAEQVQAARSYDLELYAQQRQMLCLQEDQQPGRAERCLRVYQEAKREGIGQ